MENSPLVASLSVPTGERVPWPLTLNDIPTISVLSVMVVHARFIQLQYCYWEKPKEQRIIVLLLLISPIQALVSYVQFRFSHYFTDSVLIILDSIKQSYTALIFPLFLSLLYTYLKLNDETLSSIYVRVIIGGRQISNVFPVTLIQPEPVSISINNLKIFEYSAWQFVVIRLVCSVLMTVFQLLGMYPDWLSCVFFLILNLSFVLAYYTTYIFYQAFCNDFRLHVYYKFVFFRLILFTCFFQGAVISLVKGTGIIQADLQNILVTVEMLFAMVPARFEHLLTR